MSFVAVMEPQEAFIGKAMKRPNVRTRLPLKVKPLEVKLKR
jgi:hypothetical protein